MRMLPATAIACSLLLAMPAFPQSNSTPPVKTDDTGVPMYRSQAVMSDQPGYGGNGAYIIDEYGNRYDSRGNLIGRGSAPRRR